jgi:hypothetical protein
MIFSNLSLAIACSDRMQWVRRDDSHGWQDKSPDLRLGHVVGWIKSFGHWGSGACWRLQRKVQRIQHIERRRSSFCGPIAMTVRDDEINVPLGRIRHGNRSAKRPKSFVGQVMRAARKAGHTGKEFGARQE